MAEIILHHSPMTRSMAAIWLLEELGADYQINLHDVRRHGRTPEYLAINPTGKVPAITHQGRSMGELPAISLYLCDLYPDAKMAPAHDDPARMDYVFWSVFRGSALEPGMTIKAAKAEVPYGVTGWNTFDDNVDLIAKRLEGREFIAADHFTGADILIASLLNMARFFKVLDRDIPAIGDYVKRMRARDAYKRSEEIGKQGG